MSLFKAREWWSVKPDGQEECDRGCLVVANVDNDSKKQDKVVVGSFQGMLRIYYPHQAHYKIDDLMLESNLGAPILQLEAGRFLPYAQHRVAAPPRTPLTRCALAVDDGSTAPGKIGLAVLHPRKLVVYAVNAVVDKASGGTAYYELAKAYEHKLERTAYNMCSGPFGGVHGKDFICVQSMDGQLYFLEHENFAFSRYLNNFLLPGPICYVAKTDSFVTANSSMEIECYKYQVLSSSSGSATKIDDSIGLTSKSDDSAHGLLSSKKVQTDWSLNLGEHVTDIYVARYSRSLAASQVDILVVGEKTLFTLKEQGGIRLQKRLDYNPSTSVVFAAGGAGAATGQTGTTTTAGGASAAADDVGGSNQNLIIATHQSSLMVYRDMQLVWAARVTSVPIAVRIAAFGGVKGMIVTLNDQCHLQISYLGTDPPAPGVAGSAAGSSGADSKELDYESMDAEHRALLKVIRDASHDVLAEPTDTLILRAQVPAQLSSGGVPVTPGPGQPAGAGGGGGVDDDDFDEQEKECARNEQGKFVSVVVRLHISNPGKDDLEAVNLTINAPPAFLVLRKSLVLPTLKGGTNKTPFSINIRFRVSNKIVPSSLGVDIIAAYTTSKGEPRSSRCEFQLPFCLACRMVAPLKNPTYPVTLDTNKPPPSLERVFPDIILPAVANNPELKRTSAHALSVLYWGSNADATILVSTKGGRYRIQSGRFDALALLTEQLSERLTTLYAQDAKAAAAGGADAKAAAAAAGDSKEKFEISYRDNIPFADYWLIIDKHFKERELVTTLRALLDKSAHQFRVIQKRLLVRFKDKTPVPFQHLDTLLAETYQQLNDLATRMETCQRALKESTSQLSASTTLMLVLIKAKYGLDDANSSMLRSYLSPHVNDSVEQGWEECTEAAMTHLLRTVLGKSGGKDGAGAAAAAGQLSTPLVTLKDTVKLKKHLQMVCERFGKGMKLITPPAAAAPSAAAAKPVAAVSATPVAAPAAVAAKPVAAAVPKAI